MKKTRLILVAVLMATALGCVDDIEVDLDEVAASNLPPDPGNEGKRTLAGVDSDDDGVRDDVQIAIYERHPDDEEARQVLSQKTKSLQEAVIAGSSDDQQKIFEAAESISQANGCLVQKMSEPQAESDFLSRHVVNTSDRSEAYIKFNEALDGQFFGVTPSDQPCE